MRTLGTVYDEKSGYGPGFNFLRIALAISVMMVHSFLNLSLQSIWNAQPIWLIIQSLLPMFFALSGFLISASAVRLSLSNFLINRGLRIIPALAVEIILSALVIGPLFTKFTLRHYFSDNEFLQYFTNIIGLMNYQLPGLFYPQGAPWIVNGALWTVPYEIFCYFMISVIILFRLFNRPIIIIAAIGALTFFPDFLGHYVPAQPGHHGNAFLLRSFLIGHLFYVLRSRIPFNATLFLGCCLMVGSVSAGLTPKIANTYHLSNLLCFCITYIAIYIGMSDLPESPVISKGDYSYGIYLYHSPIINCVQQVTLWNHNPFILFGLSLPFVACFAVFSWICIEKPILKMRKHLSFTANRLNEPQACSSN